MTENTFTKKRNLKFKIWKWSGFRGFQSPEVRVLFKLQKSPYLYLWFSVHSQKYRKMIKDLYFSSDLLPDFCYIFLWMVATFFFFFHLPLSEIFFPVLWCCSNSHNPWAYLTKFDDIANVAKNLPKCYFSWHLAQRTPILFLNILFYYFYFSHFDKISHPKKHTTSFMDDGHFSYKQKKP